MSARPDNQIILCPRQWLSIVAGDLSIAAQWENWLARAERAVATVLDSLPQELRDRAQSVTVSYERKPGRELVAEGLEEDTLGLFVGSAFAEDLHSAPMPQEIILYLENIWELAESDPEVFEEEVRTTFLHELGHYLGLDEDDLTQRGLE